MLLVDDRKLLDRFRRGERDALEKVYMTYSANVAAFLRGGFSFQSGSRSCRYQGARSAFDLEDKVHEVFARAFAENARLGYDGLTPYKAYLLTIARNAVIDDFRRKERALVEFTIDEDDAREPARAPTGEATEPMLGTVAPSGDPHRDAENAELVAIVASLKSQLAPREREVFELRFEKEQEHQDIAAKTGLTASKIKTSEQRIREMFFSALKKHGYLKGFEQTRHGWLSALRPAKARGK